MTETPEPSIYEKAFVKSDKTDAILVVQGKKLHDNKAFLSIHSDYFKTLFYSNFKENSMEEIEIKDVDFEDFAIILSLVHPNSIEPKGDLDFLRVHAISLYTSKTDFEDIHKNTETFSNLTKSKLYDRYFSLIRNGSFPL